MGKYEELFEKIKKFAEEEDKIKSMVLFGSRARSIKKADDYSDYDIIFFVDDIKYFTEKDEWLKEISDYYISFVEHTAVQDYERRIFFDDAMDMDFIFYNAADAERITNDPIIKAWYSRGYRIIVDKIDYSKMITGDLATGNEDNMLTEAQFNNLLQTFWFHTIWSVKKVMRGEIWSAKNCIDSYLKTLLRQVIEYHEKADKGWTFDTWHDGRFFDDWVTPKVKLELNDAYGRYDAESLNKALLKTMELFSKEARTTAVLLNYSYPVKVEEYAFKQVNRLVKG